MTYPNKANYNCKYKPVKAINLIHYRDRIYVAKTLRKLVLKWYHYYLQNPSGDKIYQTLTTIYRWSYMDDQAQKIRITCKDCHKFKNRNSKYGLMPTRYYETLKPWHKLCVDPIGTCTILAKSRLTDNKIIMKELQLLFITFIDP